MGGLFVCSPIPTPEPAVFNPRRPSWRSDKTIFSSLASVFFPLYNISALKNASSVKSATRPSTASTILKTKPERPNRLILADAPLAQQKFSPFIIINNQTLLNESKHVDFRFLQTLMCDKLWHFYNHLLCNETNRRILCHWHFHKHLMCKHSAASHAPDFPERPTQQ